MYRAHLATMTVTVESPIRRKRFQLTPRQAAAWSDIAEGGTFNQRDLATKLGYSLGGANAFVRTVRTCGLMRAYTARGREGVTVLRPINGARVVNGALTLVDRMRDVLTANVHQRTSSLVDASRSTLVNIRSNGMESVREVIESITGVRFSDTVTEGHYEVIA